MNPISQSTPLFYKHKVLNQEDYQQNHNGEVVSLSHDYLWKNPALKEVYSPSDISIAYKSNDIVNENGFIFQQNTRRSLFDILVQENTQNVNSFENRQKLLFDQSKQVNFKENQRDVNFDVQIISNEVINDYMQLDFFQQITTFSQFDNYKDNSKKMERKIQNQFFIQGKQSKNYKRLDDSNNAHKKMTTCLNKANSVLSKKHNSNTKIRFVNKQHEKPMKASRSSRYGFICKIIYLQYAYGELYMNQLFHIFCEQIIPQFKEQNLKLPNSDNKEYLLKLPDYYMRSFKAFLSGKVEQATELIYTMDQKFKQKLYMKRGLQKVIQFRNQLLKFK